MINRLKNEIDIFLTNLPSRPKRWLANEKEDNLYEAFIFTLVARALASRGWSMEHKNIKGQIDPNQFIFRTSPGKIWSDHREYSYLRFKNGSKEYELHLGVEIQGASTIESEADVSLIQCKEAESARENPRSNPRSKHIHSSKVPIIIECKCYTNPLGKNIGREFLGLSRELKSPKNSLRLMATTLDDNGPVSIMVRYHGYIFCNGLTPSAPSSRISDFKGLIAEFSPNLR